MADLVGTRFMMASGISAFFAPSTFGLVWVLLARYLAAQCVITLQAPLTILMGQLTTPCLSLLQ